MLTLLIIAAAEISGQGDGAFVSSGFVTALLGTGGIAGILGYLGGRKHRVTVEPTVCEERHKLIGAQMEDVFSRLRRLEANDAAQSAKLDAIDKRVESMDAKLDRIIAKIG